MPIRDVVVGEKDILPISDLRSPSDEEPSDVEEGDVVAIDVVNDEVQTDCVFDDAESDPEPVFDEDLYDQRPSFLLGATTRSGRAVRLSGKLMDTF